MIKNFFDQVFKTKKELSAFLYLGGVACFTFVLIVLLAAFTPLPNILSRPLIIPPALEKADAILVLSGGVYSNGSLSYFTMERIIQGVILYRSGYAKKLILSGGVSLGNNKNYDADAMKKVVVSLGVKEEDIIVENKSKDTYENLLNAKIIINEMGFRKVLLVTSATHTYRSMKIANTLGLSLIPASPTPFEEFRQTPIDRLLLFYFSVREYAALLFGQFKLG